MCAAELAKPGGCDASPGTLGDILYADKSQAPVSEREWAALVQSIAAGDQRALQALYGRTHRIVYTLIMRITGSRETAEELALDVFHDVWRRASVYDAANGSVIGWIMNQARSRAIDRLRLEHRKKRVDAHPDGAVADAVAIGPYEVLQLKEEGHLLRKAMAMLTPDEQKAIETSFFSGLTHSEAAARLNLPLGTIKTRIRSGVRKLRQALAGKL